MTFPSPPEPRPRSGGGASSSFSIAERNWLIAHATRVSQGRSSPRPLRRPRSPAGPPRWHCTPIRLVLLTELTRQSRLLVPVDERDDGESETGGVEEKAGPTQHESLSHDGGADG